jgi:hypothetical protein
VEQKYRNHGTKKRNKPTGRNKLNLNTEQKYRNRGRKKNKASTKQQIKSKHGTKL